MSATDVESLRLAYEAYAAGDFEAAMKHVHPAFEFHDHSRLDARSNATGPEAMLANRRQVVDAFEDVSYEPLEFVEVADQILVRVRASGRGRHTGLTMVEETGQVWTLRDGQVVRLDVYRTWDEARRAVGL